MIRTKLIVLALIATSAFAQIDSLEQEREIETLNQKVVSLEKNLDKLQELNSSYSTKEDFEKLKTDLQTVKNESEKLLKENESLRKDYISLKRSYNRFKSDLEGYIRNTTNQIDSLEVVISANSANIKKTANELDVKIEDNQKAANQSLSNLGENLSRNTLYWIIAVLILVILLVIVFVLLRQQIFKQRTDLNTSLEDTRKVLEEEGVKLDNKLVEVLESQLKIMETSKTSKATNEGTDHSLALKVADEIVRIQKNLARMDEKTKGLKQLSASVKRIQDNFASNGYELVEMLGKSYNDGMKVSANFIPDEDLETGQQIITRIIKPQVNYIGVMIQSAQIEVSVGE